MESGRRKNAAFPAAGMVPLMLAVGAAFGCGIFERMLIHRRRGADGRGEGLAGPGVDCGYYSGVKFGGAEEILVRIGRCVVIGLLGVLWCAGFGGAAGRTLSGFKLASGESFKSVHAYFGQGRKASFLAAGATAPYVLKAEFQVGTSQGAKSGRYEDTWVSATEWKREAWIGTSHLVRSQSGQTRYMVEEGPQGAVLRAVMLYLEPIPAEGTIKETDWRVRRETLLGVKAVHVARRPLVGEGAKAGTEEGYWFDEEGHLLQCQARGHEARYIEQAHYGEVRVARRIDVRKDGKVGLSILVKRIESADRNAAGSAAKGFVLKGHEWQPGTREEVR